MQDHQAMPYAKLRGLRPGLLSSLSLMVNDVVNRAPSVRRGALCFRKYLEICLCQLPRSRFLIYRHEALYVQLNLGRYGLKIAYDECVHVWRFRHFRSRVYFQEITLSHRWDSVPCQE